METKNIKQDKDLDTLYHDFVELKEFEKNIDQYDRLSYEVRKGRINDLTKDVMKIVWENLSPELSNLVETMKKELRFVQNDNDARYGSTRQRLYHVILQRWFNKYSDKIN